MVTLCSLGALSMPNQTASPFLALCEILLPKGEIMAEGRERRKQKEMKVF